MTLILPDIAKDAAVCGLHKKPAPDMSWDLRLILADRLEDLGAWQLAEGCRWQAREQRCPYKSSARPQYLWNRQGSGSPDDDANYCDLPPDLWYLLRDYIDDTLGMRYYATWRRADWALWIAYARWKKLPSYLPKHAKEPPC